MEHRVASGGMGEVFSARAVGAAGTSKRVCIKRILASRKLSEGAVAHFISEATLSMQLSHANIVPVFDFGRAEDGYYLVMEWVDGVDLCAVLDASIALKAPLTVAEISYVGARLMAGDDTDPEDYAPVPWLWSNQFGGKFQLAGHVRPDDDLTWIEGTPQDGAWVAVTHDGTEVKAVMGYNRNAKVMRTRMKMAGPLGLRLADMIDEKATP